MDKPNDLYWFIFYNDLLILRKKEGGYTIPCGVNPPVSLSSQPLEVSESCVVASLNAPFEETEEYVQMGLRASWDYLEQAWYDKAGKAFQILYWDENSRYCPACGTKTVQTAPITKRCPSCGKEQYPPISAASIVLIRKGNSILLVRTHNFKGTFHGLVAGFLEVGETLEECVKREVMEETNLQVDNITYFGNQPWPYPSSLMVGFIADYAGGEIKIQEEELLSAAFYTRDNLPPIPRKLSLARKMIDWWLEQEEKA